MSRILFISEYMNPPFDEGIKKTVIKLFSELEQRNEILAISRFAYNRENIITINTNALFISRRIVDVLKSFMPEVIIYLPFASATFASYLRLAILSMFSGKKVKKIFITLQPKSLKKWQIGIIQMIKPKFALTPSPELSEFWNGIGVKHELIPLLTDFTFLEPIKHENSKKLLRKKYGLPAEAYIISHVGHLNEGRNLMSLTSLQKAGNQVLIIGSSSTPDDSRGPDTIKSDLLKIGVRIIDTYIADIQEIYQLSDLYIFPVIEKNSSIGMPLSILEARACGIPVVTTDFGSVKTFLGSDGGNIYYYQPNDFLPAIIQIKKEGNIDRGNTSVQKLSNVLIETIELYIKD